MRLKNLLLVLPLALSAVTANAEDAPDQWYGQVADRQLMSLAPESDFVADEQTWNELWHKWSRGEAVPEVDFGQELVVVATVSGPNRMFGNAEVDEQGHLTFKAGSTRMAGPGFAYLMRRVSREGIKTVNGNALPAYEESVESGAKPSKSKNTEESGDSIKIDIVGTVETGVMAIGGETTGTTILANGITFELDLGGDAKLERMAADLSGKRAAAGGSLRREPGVERGARWVVAVKTLNAVQVPSK